MKNILILGAVLLIAALSFFAFGKMGQTNEGGVTTLDFVMAHKPDNEKNVALLQDFADRVAERTNGDVHINLINPIPELEADSETPIDPHLTTLKALLAGKIAMSQIAVKRFEEVDEDLAPLTALDAPRVFRSHAHAAKVLDGVVGDDLRAVIDEGSEGRLHALDFTYSGGYRNIISTIPIDSLADLRGLVTRNLNYFSSKLLGEKLGLEVKVAIDYRSPEWINGMVNGELPIEESENLRTGYYQKAYPEIIANLDTVLETQHNLFLTLLVFNKPIFDALTKEQQDIITEEARHLALEERALSIAQAEEVKNDLEGQGVRFVALSPEDVSTIDAYAAEVRDEEPRFKDWFDRFDATQ